MFMKLWIMNHGMRYNLRSFVNILPSNVVDLFRSPNFIFSSLMEIYGELEVLDSHVGLAPT